jgi:hypothetical protein
MTATASGARGDGTVGINPTRTIRRMRCPRHGEPADLPEHARIERGSQLVVLGLLREETQWVRRESGWVKKPNYRYAICPERYCGCLMIGVTIRATLSPSTICTKGCEYAQDTRCVCACWGKNHGKKRAATLPAQANQQQAPR